MQEELEDDDHVGNKKSCAPCNKQKSKPKATHEQIMPVEIVMGKKKAFAACNASPKLGKA